ncbi:YihY/virulence factor BrkB family protein [Streptomyces sp. 549]|nr:YihY/virulence factor BrkB family protein [Streptomyces sp. 549]MDK1476638.1 YihY/virulence factor BrkB family protein [Streptomyces sp. 549]
MTPHAKDPQSPPPSERDADGSRRPASDAAREAAPEPDQAADREAPDQPGELPTRSWWQVARRTAKEFLEDELPDRAAALTYYGVLSIFPALLVLVSLLGVVGERATDAVLENLQQIAPGAARDLLENAVTNLRENGGTGGVMAVIGLLGALWSSSAYVAGFIRASNKVYDLPEGRPVWKITPLRVGLTVLLALLLAAGSVIVVLTGPVAEQVGQLLGLGDVAVAVWSIAKWPALVLVVMFVIALLYWAAPNVRGPGFRWLSPGSFIAVLLWLATSGAFAFYVANFGSYNRTYGTLAGVIVFLVWLWLSNLAILLGLEFDAELRRARAVAAGHPVDEVPYAEPRDTRKWPDDVREEYEQRVEDEEEREEAASEQDAREDESGGNPGDGSGGAPAEADPPRGTGGLPRQGRAPDDSGQSSRRPANGAQGA